ncbi:MAG: dihydrofolate reductase [Nocardioides sp.]
MPELPEVEVVRAGLERHVVGTTILSVDVLHPRPVRRDPRGPAGFAGALVGRTLTGAHRRGKYFWLALDSGDALLGHLGMSGQMLVQPSTVPDERHLRVRFTLDGAPGDEGASASPLVEARASASVSKPARPGQRVVLVAAVADNGVIGADGDIPWRIPEDFAHFKATTMGHTLVMGRATYDSIGRPLPGRATIVLTRDLAWTAGEYAAQVLVAHSFAEALALAADLPGDVMVVGGAQVYALALPYATHQVLTEVHQSPEGDTVYPVWDRAGWVATAREARDGWSVSWWERRDSGESLA